MKPGDKIKFSTKPVYSELPLTSTYTGILSGFTTKIIKVEFPQPSIALEPKETFKWEDITKIEVI